MKLIIVSGQEGADVESLFEKVISENGYVYQYAPKMVFPEIRCFYDTRELYIIM